MVRHLDSFRTPSLCLRSHTQDIEAGMKSKSQLICVLTDSHFLIPLAVFVVGLAMLIAVH
jgi:hypothetical protein